MTVSDPTATARETLDHAAADAFLSFDQLPRAHGEPRVHGVLRAEPGDFVVAETLNFEPSDTGAHCLLQVRKTAVNTEWVARRLAETAELPLRDLGYAGLKDRHAVATQWFSLPLGGRPLPDFSALAAEGIDVLACRHHGRKLKRGAIAWNDFELVLRNLSGDRRDVDDRVSRLAARGVPNYFGPQRFGREAGNLARARTLLTGVGRRRRLSRHQRGLLLSAARAALFNQVAARRVGDDSWDQALVGDRLQLAGTHSHFLLDVIDQSIEQRLAGGDLSPTGPLCGVGPPLVAGAVADLEAEVLAPWTTWIDGLAQAGLRQERRSLILHPVGLSAAWLAEDRLRLRFRLPPGAYATALLRELMHWTEPPLREESRSPTADGAAPPGE